MQRRAAAIYVAFFLIVGAASYSLIATAQEPTVSFEEPEQQLQANDSFELGDQSYTVEELNAEMSGGGHGEAPELTRSGTIAWTNESATYTEAWENNSTVTADDGDWRVVIPNETDPDGFTLREEINKTSILESDPDADNETVTRDGQEYVIVTEDGSPELVPAEEYFPDPQTTSHEEGGTIDYRGNETTFSNVSSSEVTVSWSAPRTETAAVVHQANVTLGDQTYLAFFPNNETLVLTQNFQSYQQQTRSIDVYHERVNGLWGVTALSFATAVLMLGMAYLPSRY